MNIDYLSITIEQWILSPIDYRYTLSKIQIRLVHLNTYLISY